ncbi:MAG TPA: hypothetical protein VF008_16135 [Niastella sp.]
MRHIFAVSNSDTNMQGAKSMQKYDETALRGWCVTILEADIYVVMTDRVRKEMPYRFMQALFPKSTPCADETFKDPC